MVRVYNSLYSCYKNLKNGTIDFAYAYDVLADEQKREMSNQRADAFVDNSKRDHDELKKFNKEMGAVLDKERPQTITGNGKYKPMGGKQETIPKTIFKIKPRSRYM